jgi:DNA-binding IclR family transcriptional regulator
MRRRFVGRERNRGAAEPVQTVETALSVYEALKQLDGAGVSTLATELDLAKSTVHRHLNTLDGLEWVVRRGDVYYPSLGVLEFAEYARNRRREYRMAERKVAELAAETDERAQFLVEEHGRGIYVHRDWGRKAVQTDPGIGKSAPLHATAAGKAILAHLPRPDVEEILDWRGLPRLTDNTVTDRETLFEELERVRDRGYSLNDAEKLDGVRAVGVVIRRPSGQVVGALSVSGPAHRLVDERFEGDLPELLRGVAQELELNVAHG